MINALSLLLFAAASPIAAGSTIDGRAEHAVAKRSAQSATNAHVEAQATIIRATIVKAKPSWHSDRETDREYHRRKSALMIEFY